MKRAFFISVLFVFVMCFASSQSYAQSEWTGNINIFYGIKTLDSDDWTANSSDLIIDDITLDGTPITMSEWIMEDKKLVSVDEAREFGINADFGPKSWPVCFTIGLMKASGEDSWSYSDPFLATYDDITFFDVTYLGHAKLEVTTEELRLGVKKIFELAPDLRPYIAGGLAWVSADVDLPYSIGIEADDPIFGYFKDTMAYKYDENDSGIGYWFSGGAYWIFAGHYNIGIEFAYSKANIDFGGGLEGEAGGLHYGLFAGYHW